MNTNPMSTLRVLITLAVLSRAGGRWFELADGWAAKGRQRAPGKPSEPRGPAMGHEYAPKLTPNEAVMRRFKERGHI